MKDTIIAKNDKSSPLWTIPNDKGGVVVCSGNMNPPTRGHLLLATIVKNKSIQLKVPAYVITTMSHNGQGLFENDIELAGRLFSGDKTTQVVRKKARSPLSTHAKLYYINKLFNDANGLDINIASANSPYIGIGDLIQQGYTDIVYYAGSEYFTATSTMINRLNTFINDVVNVGRKKQNPSSPLVKFRAVNVDRDVNNNTGISSITGSKARNEIYGFISGHYDETTAKLNYSKQSGWETPSELLISDTMFSEAVRSYRGT